MNAAALDDELRERRDLVSGEVLPESRLVRFVAGPDGDVVPDVAASLPGRGMWVAASRDAVALAARKNLFSKSAKASFLASSLTSAAGTVRMRARVTMDWSR